MENSLQWWGNLSLTHNGYHVPTLESFALDSRYLYWEKQILIQTLEQWLKNWNREFGYMDRQSSKMRWPRP